MVVHDEYLETLARTRGKDLRSLKINKCLGFSTHGLTHVSKYCNQLRTLCLKYSDFTTGTDGVWLHLLALNSTVLERLHVSVAIFSNVEDLTLLAKNCCNSLISLKIGACYLSKLGDVFRYAVKLEHLGGYIYDKENELVNFRLTPNMCSLSIEHMAVTQYSIVLPFVNNIRKLKLEFVECECFLFKTCPNLEVLDNEDVCGDRGLHVIGQFCKKLRKLTHNGLVTHIGLIALAKGCTKLECVKVRLRDISNETIKCLGTHLKNLHKFCLNLVDKDGTTNLPLDNGIQAMLMGCSKLKILDISLQHGRLTDMGLQYIGYYGANLSSLSLTLVGNSSAGLVKLSHGCPRLRKLKLRGCPFSKPSIVNSVFKIPSLRYFRGYTTDFTTLKLTRPEFQL